MKPIRPVIRGKEHMELILAEDQPEYIDLPVILWGHPLVVVSRWKMTWRERWKVFRTGSIYLQQMTFGQKLQPQLPTVDEPHEIQDSTQCFSKRF